MVSGSEEKKNKMSYTKDKDGNIVKKSMFEGIRAFGNKRTTEPVVPQPPKAEDKPEAEQTPDLVETILYNQKAIYDLLLKVSKDLEVIRDESVSEAARKFKELQAEIQEQLDELESKKPKEKKKK